MCIRTYVFMYLFMYYAHTMYCYTSADITCICNILGQEHVCGMLTKLNILNIVMATTINWNEDKNDYFLC